MRFVTTSNFAIGVNLNGNVQAILLQDYLNQITQFILVHADILSRICQRRYQRIPHNFIAGYVRMRTLGQWCHLIQIGFGPFNDPCATL